MALALPWHRSLKCCLPSSSWKKSTNFCPNCPKAHELFITNNEMISGQGNIPDDFQHCILKYDYDSVYPSVRLEYVYYQMALVAGIEMMPSQICNYGNVSHFLTHRFDRVGNERIHTQTLAAMAPLANSY